jgi:uncharacterized protein
VREHGFDDLEQALPIVHAVIHDGIPLSATCEACPEVGICGGGYLPHRFSRERRFDNPSVWCADILRLIDHMRATIEQRPALEAVAGATG